jgi:hypothetical protein
MSATPLFAGALARGVSATALQNSDSTSAGPAVITGATNGTMVNRIVIHSGPTTAPGNTAVCVILHNTTIIGRFTITNTADVLQFDQTFDNLNLLSTDTIKLQARTALSSGATFHAAVYGQDI